VRYQSGNLITPLVNDILTTELSGTTCVLTRTNEEALQITGLLLKNGAQAKLIQTNDGFSLHNLSEVRFFLSKLHFADDVYIISDDTWANAKRDLTNTFGKSHMLSVCLNIINDFEAVNTKKKYKSDLEVFIRESRLEDFFNGNSETIYVSTIHKAKGKEFDHVFLMLENFYPATDEDNRQLYVAMTRAKQHLTVHLDSDLLDTLSAERLERVEDREIYLSPNELSMHLTYKDVWLDYFKNKQYLVSQLVSGDVLTVTGDECLNTKGQSVLKFSRQFLQTMESLFKRNYTLKSARVNFVVYWQKEGTGEEIRIILPELFFENTR
jgi:ATP-dependent DNA helicase RecQ